MFWTMAALLNYCHVSSIPKRKCAAHWDFACRWHTCLTAAGSRLSSAKHVNCDMLSLWEMPLSMWPMFLYLLIYLIFFKKDFSLEVITTPNMGIKPTTSRLSHMLHWLSWPGTPDVPFSLKCIFLSFFFFSLFILKVYLFWIKNQQRRCKNNTMNNPYMPFP